MKDKEHLVGLLTETHAAFRTTLEGIDLEMRVYSDSDWRIKDIIGHIATWDRQVAKSIRAFQAGSEYLIPDLDEDAFNQQAVLDQWELSAQQVSAEWVQAREDLKQVIQELAPDQFKDNLLYPWGDERGSVSGLIKYMVDHEIEHRNEIVNAIQASLTE